MDKLFDLLDIAIAVILLVVALTIQIHSHQKVIQDYRVAEKGFGSPTSSEAEEKLYYTGNGLECLSYLNFLNQDREAVYTFAGAEYGYSEFCEKILKIETNAELSYVDLNPAQESDLLNRRFIIYQQQGKWRIDEK